MGWTMVALAGVQAVMSIQQGEAQKREAELNATLMEGKAGLIDVQKGIEARQYDKAIARQMGSGMVSIAGMGVKASGSPMAVLLESQKNMELDKAIGQFNLEQQKRYTLSEADALRRQGKAARSAGYMGAFANVLQGGANYAMYKGYMNKPKTSFDLSSGAKAVT